MYSVILNNNSDFNKTSQFGCYHMKYGVLTVFYCVHLFFLLHKSSIEAMIGDLSLVKVPSA